MNFFRILVISLLFIYTSNLSMADSHTKEQDIIDKAKEINKKIKVIILEGAGKGFSAGHNLKEVKNLKIKDAASVILIRNSKSSPSVLMGQRGKNASFMPNKFVFPGGAVEKNDFQVNSFKQLNRKCSARMAYQCNDDLVFALSVAAIRELFEETGIIVGHKKEWTGVIPPEWKPFANLSLIHI